MCAGRVGKRIKPAAAPAPSTQQNTPAALSGLPPVAIVATGPRSTAPGISTAPALRLPPASSSEEKLFLRTSYLARASPPKACSLSSWLTTPMSSALTIGCVATEASHAGQMAGANRPRTDFTEFANGRQPVGLISTSQANSAKRRRNRKPAATARQLPHSCTLRQCCRRHTNTSTSSPRPNGGLSVLATTIATTTTGPTAIRLLIIAAEFVPRRPALVTRIAGVSQ